MYKHNDICGGILLLDESIYVRSTIIMSTYKAVYISNVMRVMHFLPLYVHGKSGHLYTSFPHE